MKLLVLSPQKQSTTTNMIISEAKNLFSSVSLVPIKNVAIKLGDVLGIYYGNDDLTSYDYLLPRIDSVRARFGYQVMNFFDMVGMKKPYKAETILIAHNKFATIYELKKAGLPVPETFYTAAKSSANDIINKLEFPAVIKLVSSFGGKGVMFLESKEAASSVVKTLDLLKQELMLEEYVKNPGEDIRIFVIGQDFVAMKRVAALGEKRANIYAGGKGKPYRPSSEELELALKAADVIDAKICGIDLVEGPNGPEIIEANINPGIVGISKATGVNVARRIAQFCYDEAKA